jgi:FkbM family methyltransferase
MLSKLLKKIMPLSKQEKRVMPWWKINGDETLRKEYDLDEDSVVFDMGGYEGKWSRDIFAKYACRIYIFEPVPEYFSNIRSIFLNNRKVEVFNYGLDKDNKNEQISLLGDSSSIFKRGGKQINIKLVKAADFLAEKMINKIDLIKINIEGGEYDLLEHLIGSGFIRNINDIQVQFHDFIPQAEERMHNIQSKLKETHYLTYQYPFVWENWRIKDKT